MLPNAFLEWWFAPWTYAVGEAYEMPVATDQLGKRDGYRLWCRQARISADLPARFDAEWSIAAMFNGPQLIASARLFAGLIAARQQNYAALNALSFTDRKWCASIAATQPLRARCEAAYSTEDALEVKGLAELAYRIEQGFPGNVAPAQVNASAAALAKRVDGVLNLTPVDSAESDASTVRAQRCWALCQYRVASGEKVSQSKPAARTRNDIDDVQKLTTEIAI